MQKSVLCANSLAGAGRCGLTIALPVLSAMGHEACCMPTALLSTHTGGFGVPARADISEFCNDAAAHYKQQNISFNGVYSGYMTNSGQLSAILEILLNNKGALFVLDPVMGDKGKMYSSLPADMPRAMCNAAKAASVITPNETEAALLLGDNDLRLATKADAQSALNRLAEICGGDIVLTGLKLIDNTHVNAVRKKNGEIQLIPFNSVSAHLHGTGDLFASVLCGRLLNGDELFNATGFAAEFVWHCAKNAVNSALPEREGIPFEPLLHLLKGETAQNV